LLQVVTHEVSGGVVNEEGVFGDEGIFRAKDEVDGDGCHTQVGFTYLLPADEALPSNFPVQMEDIAIGMISGRNEFYDAVHETVLRYAPRGVLIEVAGKCPCSFRAAFRALKAYHPDAKWYYVGDEDVMMNLASLTTLLSKFNSSEPTVVSSGGGNQICKVCGMCPPIMTQSGTYGSRAFYGGTGQILSAGLLKAIEPTIGEVCAQAVFKTLNNFGDLENTCHIIRSWTPDFKYVFLPKNHSSAEAFVREAPPNFVTAHHMCPEKIRQLAHVNKDMQVVRNSLVMMANSDNDGCVGFTASDSFGKPAGQ